MTISPFEFDNIDWKDRGYWGCPIPDDDIVNDDEWKTWALALKHAKLGYSGGIAPLVNIAWSTMDPVLEYISFNLIGDAGASDVFEPLIHLLRTEPNRNIDMSICCCMSLRARGRLEDVPVMLAVFADQFDYPDAATIPVCISNLLGSIVPPNPHELYPSIQEYVSAVERAYQDALNRWQSDQVLLYEGELLSVVFLARQILDKLHTQRFRFMLRRRFEAMTGIDCSDFYNDRLLQPLSAAAIVEDFLESGEAERFEPGVRYFFGNRLP